MQKSKIPFILLHSLKETRNSYFSITLKNQVLHESVNTLNQNILTTDTFHFLELVTVILSFLNIFSGKRQPLIFFQYFRRSAKKSKSKGHILEDLLVSFKINYGDRNVQNTEPQKLL